MNVECKNAWQNIAKFCQNEISMGLETSHIWLWRLNEWRKWMDKEGLE